MAHNQTFHIVKCIRVDNLEEVIRPPHILLPLLVDHVIDQDVVIGYVRISDDLCAQQVSRPNFESGKPVFQVCQARPILMSTDRCRYGQPIRQPQILATAGAFGALVERTVVSDPTSLDSISSESSRAVLPSL